GPSHFRGADSVAGPYERVQIALLRLLAAAFQMDRKDIVTFLGIGEVDKKDLVESPFALQLRRDGRQIVCRRGDEYGVLFLLHPGDKRCTAAPPQSRLRLRAGGPG